MKNKKKSILVMGLIALIPFGAYADGDATKTETPSATSSQTPIPDVIEYDTFRNLPCVPYPQSIEQGRVLKVILKNVNTLINAAAINCSVTVEADLSALNALNTSTPTATPTPPTGVSHLLATIPAHH